MNTPAASAPSTSDCDVLLSGGDPAGSTAAVLAGASVTNIPAVNEAGVAVN